MARYLVFGGHGKVALLLAPLLAGDGHEVVGVIRNPDHVADLQQVGAEALVLDVEQASTDDLVDAVRGFDAIVWSAGAGGGNPARTRAVDQDAAIRSMDAATQAGVQRYVMVSYDGAAKDHGVPRDSSFFAYAEAKAAADDYLRGSGLQWTILGPGRLTTDEPTARIAFGDAGAASRDTSRANVALAIAAVLGDPRTVGAQIDFRDGDRLIAEAVVSPDARRAVD